MPVFKTMPMLKDIMKLLRQSTLLQSESRTQYAKMFRRLAVDLRCANYMELLFVKDVLDETWTIIRLRKASNGAINIRANKKRGMEDHRRKRQGYEQGKQELMADVEKDIKNEATRTSAFAEMSEHVYLHINKEKEYEQEIDEANALEESIKYQLELNILIDAAIKRRNDALKELEWYRKAFAADLKKASDAAIKVATTSSGNDDDAADADIEVTAESDKVSLVPEG
jgi:hypothetical protein